jgi:hypothetical protein
MPTREPQDIVAAYYQALYTGDLAEVKKLMKRESYFMTLESFGLRLALKDPLFRSQLKEVKNPETLKEVELKLSAELASRRKNPLIEISAVESNGPGRQSVRFKEDDREKVLYFSKEDEGWKINYYAGRKVSDIE